MTINNKSDRSADRGGDLENMEIAHAFLKAAKLENRGKIYIYILQFHQNHNQGSNKAIQPAS